VFFMEDEQLDEGESVLIIEGDDWYIPYTPLIGALLVLPDDDSEDVEYITNRYLHELRN